MQSIIIDDYRGLSYLHHMSGILPVVEESLVIPVRRTIDNDGKRINRSCDSATKHMRNGIAGVTTILPCRVQLIDNRR